MILILKVTKNVTWCLAYVIEIPGIFQVGDAFGRIVTILVTQIDFLKTLTH